MKSLIKWYTLSIWDELSHEIISTSSEYTYSWLIYDDYIALFNALFISNELLEM